MDSRGLRLISFAGLMGLFLSISACQEGYTAAHEPLQDASQMSQPELLQEMNQLGSEPHLKARFKYSMKEACVLGIRMRDWGSAEEKISLNKARINITSQDKVFNVTLTPEVGAEPTAVLVLASRKWVDSVRMRSLLSNLTRICRESTSDRAPVTS